jgi:hypothetical protein
VGRNRPAEAMPFDGMVRRYLIIYIVNLLLLTNKCQQRNSTDYALGVAYNTSRILQLPLLAPTPHRHVFEKEFERAHSFS